MVITLLVIALAAALTYLKVKGKTPNKTLPDSPATALNESFVKPRKVSASREQL